MPEEEKPQIPPADVNIRTMEGDIKGAPAEVVPETVNQLPEGAAVEEPGAKRKKLLIIGAIIAGALVLGLAGYFVVYPLVFPPEVEAPTAEQPTAAQPPTLAVKEHKSFFIKAPTAVSRINLNDVSLLNIAVALQNEAARVVASGSLVEVVILDSSDNQVDLGSYFSQLLPNLPADKLSGWFENDFTAYLYYDANGVWPGYVAKIKEGINMNELKDGIAQVENSDISVFYVASPGAIGQFKDGKINGYATRYAIGTRPGAAFNYGYVGNYLLISTSYNGLKAALPLLGL